MKLSDLEGKAAEIVRCYEYPKAAMLPLLWLVQQDQGYVSPEAEAWVGHRLGVSISHVREVVSFYNMFHTKPVGRRELRVCTSLPCVLRGAGDLLDRIKANLKISPGETTPGREVTLTEVECLCACEMAPMAQLDERFVGPLEVRPSTGSSRMRSWNPGNRNRRQSPNPSSARTGRCFPRASKIQAERGSKTTSPTADISPPGKLSLR